MPQGKIVPPEIKTSVKEGMIGKNGDITISTVYENLDPSKEAENRGMVLLLNVLDPIGTLPSFLSGSTTVSGLESWTMNGAGMLADDVTTLGMMINYHYNDNISFESKASIPPKISIKGKGMITAPMTAVADSAVGKLYLKNDLKITNLEGHGDSVAEARAWTPMWEVQYHFGKSGVNKFRPYVGLGLVVAYFNQLKLNPSLESDLIQAGHMIANMKNGKGGDALAGKKSSANPVVNLKSKISFAPIATVGFTYDMNENWFAVASVSYSHLTGKTSIAVSDEKLGYLFGSDTELEVNPIIAYAGVGYRF